jgi:hypothetical protein
VPLVVVIFALKVALQQVSLSECFGFYLSLLSEEPMGEAYFKN